MSKPDYIHFGKLQCYFLFLINRKYTILYKTIGREKVHRSRTIENQKGTKRSTKCKKGRYKAKPNQPRIFNSIGFSMFLSSCRFFLLLWNILGKLLDCTELLEFLLFIFPSSSSLESESEELELESLSLEELDV